VNWLKGLGARVFGAAGPVQRFTFWPKQRFGATSKIKRRPINIHIYILELKSTCLGVSVDIIGNRAYTMDKYLLKTRSLISAFTYFYASLRNNTHPLLR
jgi:hypothetical protein